MDTAFLALFFLALVGLLGGLVKPSMFRLTSRKMVAYIFGGALVVFFIAFGATVPPSTNIETESSPSQNQNTGANDSLSEIVSETNPFEDGKENESPVQETSATPVQSAPESTYVFYSVTDVVDGDTIKVNKNGSIETIRMIGIDTPETVDPRKPVQCFGKEASDKAKALLSGQKVHLETDATQGERDKYDRLLAYVFRQDGLFFNDYMIREGYAYEYTYDTAYKYQTQFKSAETEARNSQKGLWADGICAAEEPTNPAPAPTQQSTSYICSYNAYNCADFSTHAEAQVAFEQCGGISNDVHRLDQDKDGIACETLP